MCIIIFFLLFSISYADKPKIYVAINENQISKQIIFAFKLKHPVCKEMIYEINRDLNIEWVSNPKDQPAICPALKINREPWQKLPDLQVETMFWLEIFIYIRDELYYDKKLEYVRQYNKRKEIRYKQQEWVNKYNFMQKHQDLETYFYYSNNIPGYCPSPEPTYLLEPDKPFYPDWKLE